MRTPRSRRSTASRRRRCLDASPTRCTRRRARSRPRTARPTGRSSCGCASPTARCTCAGSSSPDSKASLQACSRCEDVTVQRQALEAKDLMLRAIGHEVRSPAAAMKNTLAGIMQWDETIDSTGRRTLLQEAYESSDRLLSLVESQLIIAKLETRHFEPTPEPVDLSSALTGVIAVLHHPYAERTLAGRGNPPHNLPSALCEPAHL